MAPAGAVQELQGGGAVKAQLRIEAYNVFNHTQLNEVNTNPQWISPERN